MVLSLNNIITENGTDKMLCRIILQKENTFYIRQYFRNHNDLLPFTIFILLKTRREQGSQKETTEIAANVDRFCTKMLPVLAGPLLH